MPALEGPAVVPVMATPVVFVAGAEMPVPTPPVEPPGPADSEVAFTPALRAPVVKAVLARAVTRDVIGCLETAEVDDFGYDVEALVGGTAAVVASTWDPIWSVAGTLLGISAAGHPVYEWDPKGYILTIEVDGLAVWSGMFRRPVPIGGGQVGLAVSQPSAVFAERILGLAEQLDLLGDVGSFESGSLAGWTIPSGVSATIVTDGVRGTKALRVIGDGWVSSPKVAADGAAGYSRTAEGAAFGRWADDIPVGAVVVRTRARRVGASNDYDFNYTGEASGVRPDDDDGWTGEPVTSGARMAPQAAPHLLWTEVRSFAGAYSYYDLVTLRQGITTGFPPGTERDYAEYVERIIRDLNSSAYGGSDTGIRTRIVSMTGNQPVQAMRWAHNQRSAVRDVLSMVLDADGGPECRFTAGWTMEILARLGADRTDIALSASDLLEPGWEIDPGAQVDDFVADTGRGSGTSWVSATVSQPVVSDRHRIIAVVTAPVDRSLNEVEQWAARQARVAARLHVTKEAVVSWSLGAQIAEGDVLWVIDHDGLHGLSRQMRVVTRRFRPRSQTCLLGLGATDA